MGFESLGFTQSAWAGNGKGIFSIFCALLYVRCYKDPFLHAAVSLRYQKLPTTEVMLFESKLSREGLEDYLVMLKRPEYILLRVKRHFGHEYYDVVGGLSYSMIDNF